MKLAAAKMASDKRNYDKLMCKVVHDDDNDDEPNEEEEEDDRGGRGGAIPVKKSSKSPSHLKVNLNNYNNKSNKSQQLHNLLLHHHFH